MVVYETDDDMLQAHPHGRGEHTCSSLARPGSIGSPPRAWGAYFLSRKFTGRGRVEVCSWTALAARRCLRGTLAGSSELHERQAVEVDGLTAAVAGGAQPVALLAVVGEGADCCTVADDVLDGHPQFVAHPGGDAADVQARRGLDEPSTDRAAHGWWYGGHGEDHK